MSTPKSDRERFLMLLWELHKDNPPKAKKVIKLLESEGLLKDEIAKITHCDEPVFW